MTRDSANSREYPVQPPSPVGDSGPAESPGRHDPVQAKPGTSVWMLIVAALVAVGLGAGFFWAQHRRSVAQAELRYQVAGAAAAPMVVDVVRAKASPGMRPITLPGECQPWYETTLFARVSGYVKTFLVDIGDPVKEGQVLATIEVPELDQQLASYKAKVEAVKSQIKLAQATVRFTEVTQARYKDAPKGVVSELERDQRDADYQVSQAKLTAEQSDLNAAQAEVDRLMAMVTFQKVIAPFDGVITNRRVNPGDLVTAGSTASTTWLFKMAQSDPMRVFIDVPQSAATAVRDGDKAVAVAAEYPGREFVGTIARNSRALSAATTTLRVEVDIPNKDMSLLPGMFVRVSIDVKERQPVLVIPASAMNFRSGGPQVAVVSQDGHVTFHDVVIARDLGNSVEIRRGLEVGDRVVLNINNQIAGGDVVKVNEVAMPETPTAASRASK